MAYNMTAVSIKILVQIMYLYSWGVVNFHSRSHEFVTNH